ncbi:dihydrolipoamide acyltransferase, putative [Eimeria praecox]|uniref:Dihydrolipoamide acyltransferase, putative n=1 Tax=Eimeria praecox TaxID=51316 RepID=U6GYB1_9EIME|nr:dihydrolipoamide acyltransferase, putative [Eimeria praecox]
MRRRAPTILFRSVRNRLARLGLLPQHQQEQQEQLQQEQHQQHPQREQQHQQQQPQPKLQQEQQQQLPQQQQQQGWPQQEAIPQQETSSSHSQQQQGAVGVTPSSTKAGGPVTVIRYTAIEDLPPFLQQPALTPEEIDLVNNGGLADADDAVRAWTVSVRFNPSKRGPATAAGAAAAAAAGSKGAKKFASS